MSLRKDYRLRYTQGGTQKLFTNLSAKPGEDQWLGNAGSHSNHEVTLDDVMDAYEMMEAVLTQLYEPKGDSVKKLVKEINKKKGPARLKRKRKKKAKSQD